MSCNHIIGFHHHIEGSDIIGMADELLSSSEDGNINNVDEISFEPVNYCPVCDKQLKIEIFVVTYIEKNTKEQFQIIRFMVDGKVYDYDDNGEIVEVEKKEVVYYENSEII